MPTRADVVNAVLETRPRKRYLEVGVLEGVTFREVRADTKVAVDPDFRFDPAAHADATTTYHEVPSDTYFEQVVDQATEFDVIYLDGLHTLEQTFRDLTNALAHLAPGGAVVIDDVIPNSYQAGLPSYEDAMLVRQALGSESWDWMGDVYKLVYLVQAFYPSLEYRTVAGTHGMAVLWRGRRSTADVRPRTLEEIGRLSYVDVVRDGEAFVLTPLDDIVEAFRHQP